MDDVTIGDEDDADQMRAPGEAGERAAEATMPVLEPSRGPGTVSAPDDSPALDSHRTAQHVQNTLGRAQMHNRVELVRYAISKGLHSDCAR